MKVKKSNYESVNDDLVFIDSNENSEITDKKHKQTTETWKYKKLDEKKLHLLDNDEEPQFKDVLSSKQDSFSIFAEGPAMEERLHSTLNELEEKFKNFSSLYSDLTTKVLPLVQQFYDLQMDSKMGFQVLSQFYNLFDKPTPIIITKTTLFNKIIEIQNLYQNLVSSGYFDLITLEQLEDLISDIEQKYLTIKSISLLLQRLSSYIRMYKNKLKTLPDVVEGDVMTAIYTDVYPEQVRAEAEKELADMDSAIEDFKQIYHEILSSLTVLRQYYILSLKIIKKFYTIFNLDFLRTLLFQFRVYLEKVPEQINTSKDVWVDPEKKKIIFPHANVHVSRSNIMFTEVPPIIEDLKQIKSVIGETKLSDASTLKNSLNELKDKISQIETQGNSLISDFEALLTSMQTTYQLFMKESFVRTAFNVETELRELFKDKSTITAEEFKLKILQQLKSWTEIIELYILIQSFPDLLDLFFTFLVDKANFSDLDIVLNDKSKYVILATLLQQLFQALSESEQVKYLQNMSMGYRVQDESFITGYNSFLATYFPNLRDLVMMDVEKSKWFKKDKSISYDDQLFLDYFSDFLSTEFDKMFDEVFTDELIPLFSDVGIQLMVENISVPDQLITKILSTVLSSPESFYLFLGKYPQFEFIRQFLEQNLNIRFDILKKILLNQLNDLNIDEAKKELKDLTLTEKNIKTTLPKIRDFLIDLFKNHIISILKPLLNSFVNKSHKTADEMIQMLYSKLQELADSLFTMLLNKFFDQINVPISSEHKEKLVKLFYSEFVSWFNRLKLNKLNPIIDKLNFSEQIKLSSKHLDALNMFLKNEEVAIYIYDFILDFSVIKQKILSIIENFNLS